jgi:hypothetical protein
VIGFCDDGIGFFLRTVDFSAWVYTSRGRPCTMELVSYTISHVISYFVTWLLSWLANSSATVVSYLIFCLALYFVYVNYVRKES